MGTLNLGSGSLNLTGTLAASQVNTNILRHSDGVTQHKTVNYFSQGGGTIASGLTWHNTYNGASHDLGNISAYITSTTFAVQVMHVCQFAGGAGSYGYMQGYLHQKGKSYGTHSAYTNMVMYNQYLQYLSHDMVIPWDPDGDQTLQIYVTSAYNAGTSSASNTQDFFLQGVYRQSA